VRQVAPVSPSTPLGTRSRGHPHVHVPYSQPMGSARAGRFGGAVRPVPGGPAVAGRVHGARCHQGDELRYVGRRAPVRHGRLHPRRAGPARGVERRQHHPGRAARLRGGRHHLDRGRPDPAVLRRGGLRPERDRQKGRRRPAVRPARPGGGGPLQPRAGHDVLPWPAAAGGRCGAGRRCDLALGRAAAFQRQPVRGRLRPVPSAVLHAPGGPDRPRRAGCRRVDLAGAGRCLRYR
jgi:hypothetical protein